MSLKIKEALLKAEQYLFTLEEWILVFGLTIMITFGTMQVVLRNFFDTGVEWADMLVSALVLWVGFLGASLATRKSKHINIEIISKIITNPKLSKIRIRVVTLISFIIVLMLLKISMDYTFLEASNHMYAFLKVPTWVVFIIVPISFFLIALRLLLELILGGPIEKEEIKEIKEVNL
ncbi:MAG: TRAP transporter small permease [Proteobacteria bacterium]|nr:TRAP transporter small permease [Pseudomonadota bacterium]